MLQKMMCTNGFRGFPRSYLGRKGMVYFLMHKIDLKKIQFVPSYKILFEKHASLSESIKLFLIAYTQL